MAAIELEASTCSGRTLMPRRGRLPAERRRRSGIRQKPVERLDHRPGLGGETRDAGIEIGAPDRAELLHDDDVLDAGDLDGWIDFLDRTETAGGDKRGDDECLDAQEIGLHIEHKALAVAQAPDFEAGWRGGQKTRRSAKISPCSATKAS
jgi:hypothetical protein